MKELDEPNISPLTYLKVFFRRKEIFYVSIFMGLVLGVCAGILMPKEYLSETVILVEESKSDNPLFDRLAVSTSVKDRLSGIKESIMGWNSLVELVKRLNLDKDIKSRAEYEELIINLRRNIIIKLRGQNIINLSFVGANSDITYSVVKTITDIFIGQNVERQNRETADAITFIEEQLKVYRGKIKSAEIAKYQEQLDSTELHPKVKELREIITAKKEELKKENLEFSENITRNPIATDPIVGEIKRALDSLETKTPMQNVSGFQPAPEPVVGQNSEYLKLMLLDKLDSAMSRDVKVNDQIYNTLLQRLETAKITQRLQASKEGTKYTVLDPPRLPLAPFKPNRILIAFLGMLAGAIIGIGLVIGLEFVDKSFLDVEETKNFLGVPLLGAISKINTDETIRQEKEKTRWIYSLTLAVGVIIIIVTVTILNFIK